MKKQNKETSHWYKATLQKINVMNVLQNNPAQSRYSARSSLRPINFYCAAPRARSVALVGDFNHWQPFPMRRSVDGWWSAQVELCHGHHQYRFLVDGKPMLDPHATGIARDEHDEHVSLLAVS